MLKKNIPFPYKEMGSGYWFRSIISLRKGKVDRSKHPKENPGTGKPNGSSKNQHIDKGSSSSSNGGGGSGRNHGVTGVLVAEVAATRIQTAIRSFMARKALRHLKGSVRFNVLIQNQSVRKQASTAMTYIHSWSNVQAQIRARRYNMVTESRIKQKRMENQLKVEAKIHDLEVEWCGGSETMDEILSKIQQREEAAVKRERALAYAFSHQWRANSSQYLGQAYYSLGSKENWGWSWKERWIAARPWEIRVYAQPINPKKGLSRQESKLENVSNQEEMNKAVSVKPTLSNGKATQKAKRIGLNS
ncbi:protein IQ-DOMAIN 1-like [Tripterygium wilfordii]|uniref:protein IQ-DOMAIN 1-like n=1 Tax=Tripterygium wilfordii TaxID=458696 RepID=UPI0018F80BC6|nr:protein IQ-DOMAIN 1-like [Tripterygium wilfordii]